MELKIYEQWMLGLSTRTIKVLKETGIVLKGQAELFAASDDGLQLRNFGKKSLKELRDHLGIQGVANNSATHQITCPVCGRKSEYRVVMILKQNQIVNLSYP